MSEPAEQQQQQQQDETHTYLGDVENELRVYTNREDPEDMEPLREVIRESAKLRILPPDTSEDSPPIYIRTTIVMPGPLVHLRAALGLPA